MTPLVRISAGSTRAPTRPGKHRPQPPRLLWYFLVCWWVGGVEWLAGWQRNGWRTVSRQRVKNQDLWKALVAAQKPHEVEWHWVKGHSGDRGNARVDFLARQAMADMGRSSPPDQEPVAKQLGLL